MTWRVVGLLLIVSGAAASGYTATARSAPLDTMLLENLRLFYTPDQRAERERPAMQSEPQTVAPVLTRSSGWIASESGRTQWTREPLRQRSPRRLVIEASR